MKKTFLLLLFGIFLISLASAGTFSNVYPNETITYGQVGSSETLNFTFTDTNFKGFNSTAFWRLEETSGVVVDENGNYNGTNYGMTRGTTGIFNNSFNATGSLSLFVNTSLEITSSPQTFCTWFFQEDTNSEYLATSSLPSLATKGLAIEIAYVSSPERIRIYYGNGTDISSIASANTAHQIGEWVHFCYTWDGTNTVDSFKFYINGTNVHNGTILYPWSGNSEYPLRFGYLDGSIDEVGFWNKELSNEEIQTLYNENYILKGECWYNYNETNVTVNGCESSLANYTTFILEENNYNLTLYANNSLGELTSEELSWEYLLLEKSQTYTSPILETVEDTIELNLETATGFSVGTGTLIYNGTEYTSTKTEISSTEFNLTKTFTIPAGTQGFTSENRTFYWNISIVNESSGDTTYITSTSNNQTVNELLFGLCGGSLDVPLLNFTMYDESDSTEINATENATTFQATFNLGANYDELIKNYSINNISVGTHEFDFCTSIYSSPIYADMESFYTAVGFTDKNYYLTNATLTNDTSEVNLYLLPDSDAIEFFITVEQSLIAITSAKVNVRKYFVGEGVFRTVEIDETSSDTGEFTAYLELDKKYNFIISKDGVVLGSITKTASCDEAPCTLTLNLPADIDTSFYTQFEDQYAQNVLYNLTWDPNTKIITFDFIDTTGLANYFRLKVWKTQFDTDSNLIIDSFLYTSSGTITGNLSNYTSGDFSVKAYVSRSPEKLVDFLKISMEELAGTFGTLGLFFALLIILTIVFGVSFSPSTLVMAIPFSLTLLKLIGLLSLSVTALIMVYFLAIIAILAMRK